MTEFARRMLYCNGRLPQFCKSKATTSLPQHLTSAPGLKPVIDGVCVHAHGWMVNNGIACPVNLEATHEEALQIIPLEILEMHAE